MTRTVSSALSHRLPPSNRFLSQEECVALAARVAKFARGGGDTALFIETSWKGNVAWARNQISTSGDVRNNELGITRTIRGATDRVSINQLDDVAVEAAVRRAERLLIQQEENLEAPLMVPYTEPFQAPSLWFDRTYQLEASARADVMRALVQPAVAAGMLSSGYIEVSAHGRAAMNTYGRALYHPYTLAQYCVTVRDPEGTASGWAGADANDWGRINAEQLSAIALEKCLRSRNPVSIEPGRYDTILEPQAVADFIAPMMQGAMDRVAAESWPPGQPFSGTKEGTTKIGQRVLNERITISADPTDPDCGFVPFDDGDRPTDVAVYHPVTWFEHGVLRALAYQRPYGIETLSLNTGLPNSGAFHMSGGSDTVADMIATTKRGVLVTRFTEVSVLDDQSLLLSGYTRDGLWLIENGRIGKAIKNFRFTESVLTALINVLQQGPTQRVFHPDAPIVVPPLKIRDFSFTSLANAV